MKRHRKLLLFCLIGLYLLSFVCYIDNVDYWFIDILSHFPFQYSLMSFVLTIIYLWKKNFPLAILAVFLFIFNINTIIVPGKSIQAAGLTGETFKLLSANINKNNSNFPKLLSGLKEAEADLLLLLEVTEKNIEQLQSLILTYPYRIVSLNIGSSGTGIVLMSRFPILDHRVTKYSEFGNMLVTATLEIANKKAAFYAAHCPKPTNILEFSARSQQFMSLAEQIKGQPMPVIVAGDLNATPYSPIFKRLLKISGLRDSRMGFGWQPSWPTYFPFFWLPIDHILVSPEIQVHKRTTGSYISSDHYPVLAELSIG